MKRHRHSWGAEDATTAGLAAAYIGQIAGMDAATQAVLAGQAATLAGRSVGRSVGPTARHVVLLYLASLSPCASKLELDDFSQFSVALPDFLWSTKH